MQRKHSQGKSVSLYIYWRVFDILKKLASCDPATYLMDRMDAGYNAMTNLAL